MKISVITPTYNSGATLKDTLESVLSQSYPDIEHIIIDGASTDDTAEIIREYVPRYHGRLRWISEPDRGIYDALNKGILLSTGDVVGTLGSNDFFTDNRVIKSIAEAINGYDAVYGDIHYVRPDNLSRCVRYYSSRSFRPWQMRLGFIPAHPSFYCRRQLFDEFGLYDSSFKICGDFEMVLRLIYINEISYKYIPCYCVAMRTGGISNSGLKSHRIAAGEHIRALRQNGIYSNMAIESLRYMYKGARELINKLFRL